MEQDIYVDILVFLNTVINFFLLWLPPPWRDGKEKPGEFWRRHFLVGFTP